MRPNVVLINCDDLGYGDLGCYGSTVHATPALDRMAAEGLRLDSFYMASPVCSPSRGALLTGCYPPRIGFGDFDGLPVLFPGQAVGLAPSEITLARLLSGAGYRTAMVGKWHCGDQPTFLPTDHGFDSYFGLPYSNDMGRQSGTRTDERGDQRGYPPLPLLRDDEVVEQQPDQASLTVRYLDEALRTIREPSDRPFFLYLAHMYVHLPIYVQERFARSSRNGTYGAAVETVDWVTDVILHELHARRTRRVDDRGVHERQRLPGRRRWQQRAAAGRQGIDLGGRHAGAVHRALARARGARADERRARHVARPVPDAGHALWRERRRRTAPSTASTSRACCSTIAPPGPATRSGTTA